MRADYLQFRGKDQFAYQLETLLGREHNCLTSGVAITPVLSHNLGRVYFNRAHLSPGYVQANRGRLHEAWRKYGQ